MRVLFDQGTPVEIAGFLTKHTVRTTREEGWSTLSNGDLLRVAAVVCRQQRLKARVFAAVDAAEPGGYIVIDIPVR